MYVNMLGWIQMSFPLTIFSIIFNVIPNMKVPLICYFLTPATTITVGSSVNITATPTIGQPVELWCSRTKIPKQWYTNGSIVRATPDEVWTTGGPTRKLGFIRFATSHAGTYSCPVKNKNETNTTTYTVVLGKFI